MFASAGVTQSLRLKLAAPSRHSIKHANIPSPHTCILHSANTTDFPSCQSLIY